jgi:hypothetical protein
VRTVRKRLVRFRAGGTRRVAVSQARPPASRGADLGIDGFAGIGVSVISSEVLLRGQAWRQITTPREMAEPLPAVPVAAALTAVMAFPPPTLPGTGRRKTIRNRAVCFSMHLPSKIPQTLTWIAIAEDDGQRLSRPGFRDPTARRQPARHSGRGRVAAYAENGPA